MLKIFVFIISCLSYVTSNGEINETSSFMKSKTHVTQYFRNNETSHKDKVKSVRKISTPIDDSERRFHVYSVFAPSVPDDPRSRMKNPESTLSVPGIIASNGYDCETHTIVSQGYIVNVHRIPKPKNGEHTSRNTVILQHGLFDDSFAWIKNGHEKSLGYLLANAGYDVWMPNARGSPFGREHTEYKTESKEFWNYSFHELAMYDMPAVIDYIKKVKGDDTSIGYIGYSMGSTILFTMLSLRPEYNDKLSVGIALAPAVYISNMKFPLKKYVSMFMQNAVTAFKHNLYEILPKGSNEKVSSICIDAKGNLTWFCKQLAFLFIGEDKEQLDMDHYTNNFRRGNSISWKTILHFIQMTLSGQFKQFDYGSSTLNQNVYDSDNPPEYDLSKIKLNLTLFWSENDNVINKKDVFKLFDNLPTTTQIYKVEHPKFNHIDYLLAKDAQKLVNDKVFEVLQKAMGS